MAEITVPMDDAELFKGAMADEPAQAEPEAQPTEQQEQPEGQPRDEHGRFAPKAEPDQPAEVQPEPVKAEPVTAEAKPALVEAKNEPPPGWIPAWRAREIADARAREVEAKFAQQKPQEAPDIFSDPTAAIRHTVAPELEEIRAAHVYNSRLVAQSVHGADKVKAADEAFSRAVESGQLDQAEIQRVVRSPNIYDAAVQWHERHKVVSDPRAWAMSQIGEWAKDPAQRDAIMAAVGQQPAPSGQQQRPVIQLPPSLNKTAGSGVTAAELSSEDMSDRALFQHAVRR